MTRSIERQAQRWVLRELDRATTSGKPWRPKALTEFSSLASTRP